MLWSMRRCYSRPGQECLIHSTSILSVENVDYVRVFVDEFRPHPGEMVCFDVTLINDTIVEGREFFLVGLLDLRWGEVLSIASITIVDDDSKTINSFLLVFFE